MLDVKALCAEMEDKYDKEMTKLSASELRHRVVLSNDLVFRRIGKEPIYGIFSVDSNGKYVDFRDCPLTVKLRILESVPLVWLQLTSYWKDVEKRSRALGLAVKERSVSDVDNG